MRSAYVGLVPLGILVLLAFSRSPVSAQSTAGAASLQIPPDVRAEGMGRAFSVLDRSAYAAWGNPGALGLVRGLDAVAMKARLVPDLADDVVFDYQSLVFGIGFQGGSIPFIFNLGINRTHLSYGESQLTDPGSPDPVGTFESTEKATGLTVGLGLADLVGAGIGVKWLDVDFGSLLLPPGDSQAEATAVDYGFYARTPDITFPKTDSGHPWGSVVFLGGVAWANTGGEVEFGNGRADPLPKVRREALGVEFDLVPVSRFFPTSNRWLGLALRDVSLFSVSGAFGWETDLVYETDTVNERGLEVRFLDVLAIRTGYVSDKASQIEGSTFGWGLSWLGYAGVDYASIPQFRELTNVKKWSFWFRVPFDTSSN